MKRRSVIARKLRDRRAGQSCYQKYQKRPYRYSWFAPWKRKSNQEDKSS
jgi:hypothetical protein